MSWLQEVKSITQKLMSVAHVFSNGVGILLVLDLRIVRLFVGVPPFSLESLCRSMSVAQKIAGIMLGVESQCTLPFWVTRALLNRV